MNYLQEIDQYPLLTYKQEIEVDKQTLVTSNLRMVVAIAEQYQNCGIPLDDLIQEGNCGLLLASQRFDIHSGNRFSTYAAWKIRSAILDAICKKHIVKLPDHMLTRIKEWKKTTEVLREKHPSDNEITSSMNISAFQAGLLHQALKTLSMEANGIDGVCDCGVDKDNESSERTEVVNWLLSHLDKREQKIVKMRHGIGYAEMTLVQVARKIKLGRERVRQIEKIAIKKMKKVSIELNLQVL